MPPTPTPPQDGAETSTTPTTADRPQDAAGTSLTPTPTPGQGRPQDAAGTSTTPTPTPDRRPSIAISSPPTRESYGAKIDAAISPDPQTDVALFTNLNISGYEDSAARQITNLAVAMGQVANTNMAAYKPDREMLARVIVGGKPDRNEFPLGLDGGSGYAQAVSAWQRAKRQITEPDPRAGNVAPDPDMLWYMIPGYGTYKFARDDGEGGYSAEDLGKIGVSSLAGLLLLAPVAGAGFRAGRAALTPTGPRPAGRFAGVSEGAPTGLRLANTPSGSRFVSGGRSLTVQQDLGNESQTPTSPRPALREDWNAGGSSRKDRPEDSDERCPVKS